MHGRRLLVTTGSLGAVFVAAEATRPRSRNQALTVAVAGTAVWGV